ncbi:hypothetical protein Cgig2_026983 [Carnegiea gigantea]|uniref:Uncharacterized protein n=1 Tax=Carnegiea gigantea TaxID=171969 RepID=A0A9Q1GL36_9CARY|nr:hypothetical protein Cgig2_026983 [Carnegiea gigantea]
MTGFQNSLGGIHGSVTKLEQKLDSHLSLYVHNVIGVPKLIDSVINLKNSIFGKSNRTHVPRRMKLEDISHIPNDCRDDEYCHDESNELHHSPRRDQGYLKNQIHDDAYDVMRKVKFDVPAFDGTHDLNAFVDWLDCLENYFEFYGMNGIHIVHFFKMKLNGFAKKYWQSAQKEIDHLGGLPINFVG